MKVLRYFAIAALALMTNIAGKAQDKVEGKAGIDIVSQYIWRGQDLGNVSIQPGLGIGWKGLSLNAWGSVGLTSSNDTKEFDLILGYTTGSFNIGITDYWFNVGQDTRNRYFLYDSHRTNHVFEGNIGYDFGFLNLQWFTNFAGNDGVNDKGKRAYSSYFEMSTPFKFVTCDWTASIGAVPYATNFYSATGFAITHIGLKAAKEFEVGQKLTIPIYLGITANPCSQKAYFYAGFAIQPKFL